LLLNSYPGFVAIDKPVGLSSNNLLEKLKKALEKYPNCADIKIGHGGTLDLMASGLLLVLTGSATRLFDDLNTLDKEYDADIKLGIDTDTYDIMGRTVRKHSGELPEIDGIMKSLASFTGEITQSPPAFCALKVKGIPMYRLALYGGEMENRPRKVTMHSLDLVSHEGDMIRLRISCSKGFYVRSLASDLGASLGCGAVLVALRRTRIGPYSIGDSFDIEGAADIIARGVQFDEAER